MKNLEISGQNLSCKDLACNSLLKVKMTSYINFIEPMLNKLLLYKNVSCIVVEYL